MLGWEVFVTRQGDEKPLARWRTSVFGLRWLERLVEQHRAVWLGGNGYPNRYLVSAGILLPILHAPLPRNDSPLVIGEDYVLPAGWSGSVALDEDLASQCDADELLSVEAWDQS